MGQGSLAVDAGVGPEVDQDHVARELGQGQRLVAGRVEPADDAGEVRGLPQLGQGGHLDRGGGLLGECVGVLAVERPDLLGDRGAALDVVLQSRGVAGHGALQGVEEAEGDGQGRDQEYGPGHPADDGQVRAQLLPPGGGPLGDHREEKEGERGADGVEEGDEQR